jgi:hypothetical protein
MTHSPKGEAHNLEQNGVKDSAGFSTSLARGRETWTPSEQPMACAVVTGALADVPSPALSTQGIDTELYSQAALGVSPHYPPLMGTK